MSLLPVHNPAQPAPPAPAALVSQVAATDRRPASERVASAALVEFVASWEGFAALPYEDVAGVWTIGYGHAMRAKSPADLPIKGPLTRAQALELLRRDIAKHERTVRQAVRVPLTQAEYDALVSMDFNTGGLTRSTLLKKLNAGDRVGASREFLRWSKARNPATGKTETVRGLARRRAAEAQMFASSTYVNNK